MNADISPTKVLLLTTATFFLLSGCFNSGDDDEPPVIVTFDGGGGGGSDTGTPDPDPDTGVDDPDGGEDPKPGDNCSGIRLEKAGTLDLDIPKVSVRGVVTVAGQTPPNRNVSRGNLLFEQTSGTTSLSVPLGQSGEATFDVALPPGEYDIRFAANKQLCQRVDDPALPCNSGIIRSGLPLQNDGSLNLDIPTVKVQGAVTVGDQPMPDGTTDRGSLTFRHTGGGSTYTTDDVGQAGPATYRATLLPGSYDILWAGSPTLCAGNDNPDIPCHTGVARKGIDLTSSGSLDVNLSVIKVRGSVLVNGEQMGSADGDRGTIAFVGSDGSQATTEGFGSSGGADYSLSVMPGSYEVQWQGNQALCQNSPVPPVPCNSGKIRDIELGTSGTLDIDIPRVKISGAVTVNGESVPAADPTSGTLTFSTGAAKSLAIPVDWSSGGTYDASLISSTYDISWAGSPTPCQQGDLPTAPCNSGPVKTGIALQTNGSLGLDIPAVTVRGGITANGGPIPAGPDAPGTLVFTGQSASAASYGDIDRGGNGSYELRLLADTYDISWQANEQLCRQVSDLPGLPCVGGTLREGVGLSNSGSLDIDVPSIKVRGSVTQNGKTMPDASTDRGSIAMTNVDGGDWTSEPFGSSGTPTYSLSLLPGRYVISHSGNATLCAPSTPSPTVSCATHVLKGCN